MGNINQSVNTFSNFGVSMETSDRKTDQPSKSNSSTKIKTTTVSDVSENANEFKIKETLQYAI